MKEEILLKYKIDRQRKDEDHLYIFQNGIILESLEYLLIKN